MIHFIQGPFDILGVTEVILYNPGHPAQPGNGFFRKTGFIPSSLRDFHPLDAPFRIGNQHFFFMGDDGFPDPERGFFGNIKDIRGNRSIHHGFAQAPVGMDDRFGTLRAPGIQGIDHPPGFGGDHDHASYSHGDIFFPESFADKIKNSPGSEFAG